MTFVHSPPLNILFASSDQQEVGELSSMGNNSLRVPPDTSALESAATIVPDVVVIDGRSRFDGMVQLFNSFRSVDELASLPVVGLVSGSQHALTADVLEAGFDDCLNLAMDSREIAARLRSVCRKSTRRMGPEVRFADVVLHLPGRKVYRDGRYIALPNAQFELLHFFMRNPARVFTRRDLLSRVWRNETLDEGAVTACIRRLRTALRDDGKLIQSARGGGYILDDDILSSVAR